MNALGPDSDLSESAPSSSRGGQSTDEKPPLTADEYAALHLPRFATMPHTAPVFDERSPTSDPLLLCMASKPGYGGDGTFKEEVGCSCLTEQGTKYEIPDGHCLRVARWGPAYNPYRDRWGLTATRPGDGDLGNLWTG